MDNSYCDDCKRITEVVSDHSSGDTICVDGGLVLENHIIDKTSEWRIFVNDSNKKDPIRVGGPATDPLFAECGLSTFISKTSGVSSVERWQNWGLADRRLILASESIAAMADRLGLVATIKVWRKAPTENELKLNTDGTSRNNPDPAGCGGIIREQ